jgi:hypothetical protein
MNFDKMSANERFEAILNFAINNRKADLVSLLQANGVLIDNQTPDDQLYLATARAIKFSPAFKRAFTYYMTDAIQSGSFLNFVGLNPSEQAILGMDFTGEVNSDGMDAFYSMDGIDFSAFRRPSNQITMTPSGSPSVTGTIAPSQGGTPIDVSSTTGSSAGRRFGSGLANADADTINKWLGVAFNVASKVGSLRGRNKGDSVPTGTGGGTNEPTPSWWKTQSPMAKAGIIGGGIVLIGGIILLTRNK